MPRSLRGRVMILIALAFLPVAALEVNTAMEQRRRTLEEVEEEAVRLARLVGSNQQAVFEGARQLLMTLARVDAIRYHRIEACKPLLRSLQRQNPLYANIGTTDGSGVIQCSAIPLRGPVNVSDRAYFQRTLRTREFSIGEFQTGRITGAATLNMGYPLLDDSAKPVGVVFVALDLRALSMTGARIMLPPGGTMSMTSENSIYLMRFPDPDQWLGKTESAPGALIHPGDDREAVGAASGADGVTRVYAVERLSVPAPAVFYVRVGIAEQMSLAGFALRLLRRLGLVTAIVVVALAGAWMLGSAFIVRPARHLLDVVRAVSAGNLSVRSHVGIGTGEFREIGAAFNQMADALARRIEELDEARRALAHARDDLESRVEMRTAELQRAQETLQLRNRAIASVNSAVIVTDPNQPDNPVVDVNPAFERITGYSENEAIGRNCRFLQGPETDPATTEAIRRGIQQEQDVQVVIKNYRKDGAAFWNEVKIAPVRDMAGRLTHFVGVLTDVTARIQAQENLERAAEELRRSNEELEQFAYVASHDLQEPLRMVASYTQLLARRYKDKLDQNGQEFIAYAVDGAKRMQGFIHDLLLYSRVGTHGRPFERLNVAVALHRALENLRYAIAEKNAEVVVGPMPEIGADLVQLTQLFQNLIGNALKFSRAVPMRIEVNAVHRYPEWEFTVADNGIGIDPEDCERIFVIFQRLHTRQEYEGTGIGLAICKKIVERHHGRIWVESKKGEGTVFHFTLMG